jgi:hypothetical protein
MDDQFLAVFMPLLMFVPFFVFLVFGQRRRDCPDCGRPLPLIQSPFTKTRLQWLEGGYLCRNCRCETDLTGQKVAPGTSPRPGWLVPWVLLVPPAIVGVVLLFFGIRVSRQEPAPPLAPEPPLAVHAAAEPGR